MRARCPGMLATLLFMLPAALFGQRGRWDGNSTWPQLTGLSCTSTSMTSAGTDSCTATLSTAPSGNRFTILLASDNSAVTVPASVTVPAGATSVSFIVSVASVSSAQTANLTATAGSVAESFAIQLGGSGSALGVNATSVAFGNVELNVPATQSLTLTSLGGAPVTVSGAAVTGSGFSVSGASFPLTLNPSQSAVLSVEFDPTAAGAVSGLLTIASNSSTGSSTAVGLSGTGVAVAVNLNWDAPSSSSDPVAGYNVYRAPTGTTSFQQLNTSVIPNSQTAFADTAVQESQIYDYIVESVDAGGNTSAPSNTATVAVP